MKHEWDAQRAIYETLQADITLAGLVTGVFDDIPENQPYPYIVIGDSTTAPDHGLKARGQDRAFTLHLWSQAPGMREIKQIMDTVSDILDGTTYPVDNTQFVSSRIEYVEAFRDIDNVTRHGVVRVRLRTYDTDAA